jgi:phosphoribosylaminoimidazolecarboxamide formyltransferase/IMP cyclohydrolase
MSFNNYVDTEAAWNLVRDFSETAVAIIKHTNPSGLGIGSTNEQAYKRALSTDPVSAFGGIVAFNRIVDRPVAEAVNQVFTEVVVAPSYEFDALEVLKTKKNLRVLQMPIDSEVESLLEYKQISGGFLVQEKDLHRLSEGDLQFVTEKRPNADEIRALLLGWSVCKHIKSNAIVFANDRQTLGVGAGQMNRVDSVRIAATRAERFNLPLKGSVLASDAFFPFRDNIDEAAKYGVSAIIQPGGSVRDEECVAAANEHGISMVFTGIRHFKH